MWRFFLSQVSLDFYDIVRPFAAAVKPASQAARDEKP